MENYPIKSIEKYIYYTILFCIPLFMLTCNLEEIPPEKIITFNKKINGDGRAGEDVIELSDKQEYVIVGNADGGAECLEGYIVKVNASGEVIKESLFHNPNENSSMELFLGVDVTEDGEIIAVGWSEATEENSCDNEDSCNNDEGSNGNIFFVKTSSSLENADMESHKYESVGYESCWDAGYGVTKIGGTFYVTGSWGVKPTLLKVNAQDLSVASEDIRIEGFLGEAKSAIEDSFGGIVFTGKVSEIVGDTIVDCSGELKKLDVWQTRTLFAKLSPNGNLTIDYSKSVLKDNAEGYSIIEKKEGGYMIVGLAWDYANCNFEEQTGLKETSDVVLYISNYSASGIFESNGIWGIGNLSGALDITTFEDSREEGYIITGFIQEGTTKKLLLMKVDANGTEIWNKSYAIDGHSAVGHEVISTSDGGILAVGRTVSGNDKKDVYIVKTNREGNIFD